MNDSHGAGAAQADRRRVLVVQRRLTHYRVPFFEGVRARLARDNVDFTLAVGDPTPAEREKRDEGRIDWAVHAPCTYALDGRVCLQPIGDLVKQHDFVVVTQENKMLHNIPLLLGGQHCRVGLWGHGRNFQAAGARTAGIAQSLKAALSRRADWWFAYTELSADLVREFGYPGERITVLNNSIDTATLRASVVAAKSCKPADLRARYGLSPEGPLGLYIGSLYAEKRLDLLVEGAKAIRAVHPGFHLAIVGAGPELASLRARVADLPWVTLLGPRAGVEKAELLAAADVMLNPGLVGLGILDAFTAGLPMVTTDCGLHSPEISYLQHGVNGLMTEPNAASFAKAVEAVIGDEALANKLSKGASQSADDYNMQAMVDRFCAGVAAWNSSPRLGQAGGVR